MSGLWCPVTFRARASAGARPTVHRIFSLVSAPSGVETVLTIVKLALRRGRRVPEFGQLHLLSRVAGAKGIDLVLQLDDALARGHIRQDRQHEKIGKSTGNASEWELFNAEYEKYIDETVIESY